MNFNYNTLQVTLQKETRSINVALNRPENQNRINIEMLFELEGLFGWLTSHLEVNAVVLTGTGEFFSAGFDQDELAIMSEEKMQKYMVRFQKLISGMLCLPQTIICDLKEGCSGMGMELALGADIRLGRTTCKVSFDSLNKGWVPCAGGIGLLSLWSGHATARNWTMTSKTVSSEDLFNNSFLNEVYSTSENATDNALQRILAQAPVARIQAKRAFLEAIMPELTRSFEFESIFSFSAMKTEDWKKNPTENPDESFTAARELAEALKSKSPEMTV